MLFEECVVHCIYTLFRLILLVRARLNIWSILLWWMWVYFSVQFLWNTDQALLTRIGQCSILLFDNHQWNFCFQCLEGVQHSNCYTTANTENPQKVVRQKVNEAMSDSIKRNMDIRFVFYSNSFQFY